MELYSPAKTNVMFASDLTGALKRALPGDVIALPAGVHSVYAGLHLAEVTILGLTSGKDQSKRFSKNVLNIYIMIKIISQNQLNVLCIV